MERDSAEGTAVSFHRSSRTVLTLERLPIVLSQVLEGVIESPLQCESLGPVRIGLKNFP